MHRQATSRIAGALIGLLALAAFASAQEPKKDAPAMFKQYIGVYSKGVQQQLVLKNASVKQLGDRSFLVGTPVDVTDDGTRLNPRSGVIWWIGLSEVTEFYEFETVREFRPVQ